MRVTAMPARVLSIPPTVKVALHPSHEYRMARAVGIAAFPRQFRVRKIRVTDSADDNEAGHKLILVR